MSEEKLYLVTVQYSRNPPQRDADIGFHKGLVFAPTEPAAKAQATFNGVKNFLPNDGWVLRVVNAEEVKRSILERAAKDILGWSPPVS